MSGLDIRVLGGLSVSTEDGVEIALTRKNRTLMAALVLAGRQGISRESLADLLWRDRDERQARASLRQALAAIGKALGTYRSCISAEPERIAVNDWMVHVDALEFEALAASGMQQDRDRALSLYRGDLLDGVPLKEEGFEAWLRPHRERLRAKAIALLGGCLESSCGAQRSVELASRLLELESTNEAAHRALMRTYASQGRHAAAIKQFVACRDLLSRELNIGPSHETVALYSEIRVRHRHCAGQEPSAHEGVVVVGSAERSVARPASKPSLAVMPFENLSEEPGQDYFAAGIGNDIIAALLRHRWLSVVSMANMVRSGRYSMMANDRVIEANVDYVVTGSVRKAGNHLRVSAQLIDAESGEHVWAENYDRLLGDLFEVQDEIAGMIAGHIDVEIGTSECRRVLRRSTLNLGAWDCYHLGVAHFTHFSRDGVQQARRLFARCIELDPEFGQGHAWWSYMDVLSTFYFDVDPTAELFERALQRAQRAVEIDDQNAVFHLLMSRVYLAQMENAKALGEMRTSMDLNPNLAGIYCGMGDALNYEGLYEEAAPQFDKCLQLGPRDPMRWAYAGYGALTHLFGENFEAAAEWSEMAIHYPSCPYWAYAHRVVALSHLGKGEEVESAVAELLRKQPKFSRRLAEQKLYFVKRPEQLQIYLEGLRKAGVPE